MIWNIVVLVLLVCYSQYITDIIMYSPAFTTLF